MLLGTDFCKWSVPSTEAAGLGLGPCWWHLSPHTEFPAPPGKIRTLEDKDISVAVYLLAPLPAERLPWNPRSGTKPAASADGCRKKQL